MSANGGNGGGTRTVGGGGGGGGRIAIISRNVNKLNTTFDAYGGKLNCLQYRLLSKNISRSIGSALANSVE